MFDMTSTSSVDEEEFYQRICNESRERERLRLRERGGVGGVGGRAVPGGGLLEGGGAVSRGCLSQTRLTRLSLYQTRLFLSRTRRGSLSRVLSERMRETRVV